MDTNKSDRALIVLDMTNRYAHVKGSYFEPSTRDIIPFIQGEMQYFRERMRPIFFCNTMANAIDQLHHDGDGFEGQMIQPLMPRTDEIIIEKMRANAFFETDLTEMLAAACVRTVTIVGAFSHTSVIMTAVGALDRGFSVVVPETCTCFLNDQDHKAAMRLLHSWILASA